MIIMEKNKLGLLLVFLIPSILSCSMEQKSMTQDFDLEHVSNYIGTHAYTTEYVFQEALRRNDLGIKKAIEQQVGKQESEKFFSNGWGQIVGSLIALNKHRISADLNSIIDQNINRAIEKGNKNSNPFVSVNVREQAKNIMMYPHAGKYLPWQKANITKPIFVLNNLLKKYPAKFSLVGCKCYLSIGIEGENTIIKELWETGFATLLEGQNYCGLQANQAHPHITLIDSNIIADVKDKFNQKHGSEGEVKFNAFMNSWIASANDEISIESNPIEFTHFDSSYSEDYSPFEEVVVARLQAPIVKKLLNKLAGMVKEETDYTLVVKDEDSFHLTVATKYRKQNDFSSISIEQIISSCPKKSSELFKFLTELKNN